MRRVIIAIMMAAVWMLLPGCAPSLQEESIAPATPAVFSPTPQATTPPTPSPNPLLDEDKLLSLAGIYPGERIENIAEEYGLHYLSEEEAENTGMYDRYRHIFHRSRYKTFYDGKGLAVRVFSDGTIGQVLLLASGYETPDRHQVGDLWPYGKGVEYSVSKTYGDISYTVLYYSLGYEIALVKMDIYYDRILSEAQADLNHNGADERFVLTGRASTMFFETLAQNKVVPDRSGAEFLYDDDPATRPRLTVYENEDIIWTQALQYYHYWDPGGFPSLTPMNKGRKDRFIELCYPTGGSGGDMYYKLVYDDVNDTYTIEFSGQWW